MQKATKNKTKPLINLLKKHQRNTPMKSANRVFCKIGNIKEETYANNDSCNTTKIWPVQRLRGPCSHYFNGGWRVKLAEVSCDFWHLKIWPKKDHIALL